MLKVYQDFLDSILGPAAIKSLREFYAAYCSGQDIGIAEKSDKSPASAADRGTEKRLRGMIMDAYPDHGIYGEEYGGYQLDADMVWILDPLDGTREFLAKEDGNFASLIALSSQGKLIAGAVIEPLSGKIYTNNHPITKHTDVTSISESIVACTNPAVMFKKAEGKVFIDALATKAKRFIECQNAIGYTMLIDGTCNLVVEADLKCHDIAALIPVLQNQNMIMVDQNSQSYYDRIFDWSVLQNETFIVIASPHLTLVKEILNMMSEM